MFHKNLEYIHSVFFSINADIPIDTFLSQAFGSPLVLFQINEYCLETRLFRVKLTRISIFMQKLPLPPPKKLLAPLFFTPPSNYYTPGNSMVF